MYYIAADCIKKIMMKDTVQSLIIGGNRIRDNGMKPIAEGFQHNHSLTVLKIYRCLLTVEGMHDHMCTVYCKQQKLGGIKVWQISKEINLVEESLVNPFRIATMEHIRLILANIFGEHSTMCQTLVPPNFHCFQSLMVD